MPVPLSVATWDPRSTPMRSWIANCLVKDYGLRPSAAAGLVAAGLILPVIHGLDEMAPESLPAAISQMGSDVVGSTYAPMIVTSRTRVYSDLLKANPSTLLPRMTVIELMPLDMGDVFHYLESINFKQWEHVIDRLHYAPHAPLAQVLSTPFGLSLAKRVYGLWESPPDELLDTVRFATPGDIYGFLIDQQTDIGLVSRASLPRTHYRPEDAKRWLGYIAYLMTRHNRTDFAWWWLADELPSSSRIAFSAFGFLICVITGFTVGVTVGRSSSIAAGGFVGILCGIPISWKLLGHSPRSPLGG